MLISYCDSMACVGESVKHTVYGYADNSDYGYICISGLSSYPYTIYLTTKAKNVIYICHPKSGNFP